MSLQCNDSEWHWLAARDPHVDLAGRRRPLMTDATLLARAIFRSDRGNTLTDLLNCVGADGGGQDERDAVFEDCGRNWWCVFGCRHCGVVAESAGYGSRRRGKKHRQAPAPVLAACDDSAGECGRGEPPTKTGRREARVHLGKLSDYELTHRDNGRSDPRASPGKGPWNSGCTGLDQNSGV
jgi:hypothetical protein